MKTKQLFASILALAAAAVLLSGCGGSATDSGAAAAPQPAPAKTEPAKNAGPVTITGDDMMKFNLAEFTVKAGSEVTVVFKNIGKMPKEAMGHNLVILQKGTDPMAFATASMRFPKEEYVAATMKDSVVASTRVLGPGESQTITFTAPSATGDYPFVCSFPGHTPAGMRGLMKVN